MTYTKVYDGRDGGACKPLVWIGSSLADLRRLPVVVRAAIGFELYALQRGRDPSDWKPMPSIGLGVREVRVHVCGEHRVMYLARLNDAVFVLHVFQKKTRRTAEHDLRMGRARCREAIQWHLRRRGTA